MLCLQSFLLTLTLPALGEWSHADLQVPPGFAIETLNFSVPNARQMALTEAGTLIVGSRRAGRVYAVPNALTATTPEVITLLENLSLPSGVALHEGNLYIGAVSRILVIDDIEQQLRPQPPTRVLTDTLPDKTHHGWKYLKFGPDEALYVPVGAPCNVCLSADARFASLLRMHPETAATQIWAHGIRNTVGFDWHPRDQRLWFSDNGRDMLGDHVPPEEINVISHAGQHFGYPFVHATDIRDPEYGDAPAAKDRVFTPPVMEITAHSAVLGMAFYAHDLFGAPYQDALFMAEHGSWNRSTKVGYRVSVLLEDAGGQLRYQPFVSGWLRDGENWGRPNDVLVTPNGSLLISDDQRGVIYRVTRQMP